MFIKQFLAKHFPQLPASNLTSPEFITFSAKTFVSSHPYFTSKIIILFAGQAYLTVPRNLQAELCLGNTFKVNKFQEGDILNRIELQHRGSSIEQVLVQSQTVVLVLDESLYRQYLSENILKEKTISNFPLLCHLPRKYLSLIELNTTVITENRNKKLFSQGDPVDFCYFSLDGEVSIILEKESNSPSVGKKNKSYEKQQLIIQKGEYFGFEHSDFRGYEAKVYSASATFAKVNLNLLLYVCWANNIGLQTLCEQRMNILDGISKLRHETSRCSFIASPRSPSKKRVEQDFFLQKSSKKKPLFYLNSIKSKPKKNLTQNLQKPRMCQTVNPSPRNSIKQTLFEFNIAKYDYKVKNQKLFHILRMIKQKTQQMKYSQQDIWELQKMARSNLTLFEMEKMYEQLMSAEGLDNLMIAVKLKRRYNVRFETPRTVRSSKQSPSISKLKAVVREGIRGGVAGRKYK